MLLGVNTHNNKSVIEYINGNEKSDQKASKSPIGHHSVTLQSYTLSHIHILCGQKETNT